MVPGEWTLESELLRATGSSGLQQALELLGVVQSGLSVSVVKGKDWVASGDVYWCSYTVVGADGSSIRGLVVKALVPFARSVAEALSSWMLKRSILLAEGFLASDVYFAGNGILVESFSGIGLAEFFSVTRSEGDMFAVARRLGVVCSELDRKGIDAGGLADVRVKGRDVLFVDFGSDFVVGSEAWHRMQGHLNRFCAVGGLGRFGAAALDAYQSEGG